MSCGSRSFGPLSRERSLSSPWGRPMTGKRSRKSFLILTRSLKRKVKQAKEGEQAIKASLELAKKTIPGTKKQLDQESKRETASDLDKWGIAQLQTILSDVETGLNTVVVKHEGRKVLVSGQFKFDFG